jgi:metal-responsive CopG/Arc/MetJ family transcriptional regulator
MLTARPRKVSTFIALRPDLRAELDDQAFREDCSRSEITAKAIRDYLERARANRSPPPGKTE